MGQTADTASPVAASARKGRSQPVDLVHLARHTLGDEALEREVLQLFVVQSRLYMKRLDAASDPVLRARAAHTIKGSARGIGAFAVAEAAEAVERSAADDADRERAVAALHKAVEIANRYIAGLIGKH